MKHNPLVCAFFFGLTTVAFSCAQQTPSPNPSRNGERSKSAPENADIRRPSKHDAMDTLGNEAPAEVKSAFPKAATVTVRHKELTLDQVQSIERESGATLVDRDFHSFVAHDGSHRQIGSATISRIRRPAMRLVVLFTPSMKIKKVSAIEGNNDIIGKAFLDQFAGKDVKALFRIGQDLKYEGPSRQDAAAVARAIQRDVMAMETLYGNRQTN